MKAGTRVSSGPSGYDADGSGREFDGKTDSSDLITTGPWSLVIASKRNVVVDGEDVTVRVGRAVLFK